MTPRIALVAPVPPMLARPVSPVAAALVPAFTYVAALNSEMEALRWLCANDPDCLEAGWMA